MKILLFITASCLIVRAGADVDVTLPVSNSIRFRHVGQTATVNHHAYLVTKLNLTDFFLDYILLKKRYEPYQADHQVLGNQIQITFEKVKSSLRLLLRAKAPAFRQLITGTDSLSSYLNRRKRSPQTTYVLKSLLGFGLNMLKNFNANQVYQNSLNHTRLIQTLPQMSTLLTASAQTLRNLFPNNTKQLITFNTTHANTANYTKNYEKEKLSHLQQETRLFVQTANLLMKILAALMRNKIPMGTFSQDTLKQSFNNLVTQARDEGYSTRDADYTTVYSAVTTTFQHTQEPLVLELFTLIPITRGTTLELYQFQNAPLLLDNNVMVYMGMQSAMYLALDAAGALFQEFTPLQLSQCTVKNQFYHCPDSEQAKYNKQQSCLYNVFNRKILPILKSCNARFAIATTQTIMVAPNTYKLLVQKPTTLMTTCSSPHHREPKTFDAHYTFTLTRQCHTAFTNKNKYVYRDQSALDHQIMSLPISAQATQWFESDPTQVRDFVKHMQKYYNFVPYTLILTHFDKPSQRLFLDIKSYINDVVLTCILIYMLYKFCKIIYRVVNKCCKCCNPQCCFVPQTQPPPTVNINKVVHIPLTTKRTTSYRVPPHLSQALLEPA